jgi:hypothetical protein
MIKISDESVTLNEIRVRAFRRWTEAGKPDGDGSRFWLDAERELLQESRWPNTECLPS